MVAVFRFESSDAVVNLSLRKDVKGIGWVWPAKS